MTKKFDKAWGEIMISSWNPEDEATLISAIDKFYKDLSTIGAESLNELPDDNSNAAIKVKENIKSEIKKLLRTGESLENLKSALEKVFGKNQKVINGLCNYLSNDQKIGSSFINNLATMINEDSRPLLEIGVKKNIKDVVPDFLKNDAGFGMMSNLYGFRSTSSTSKNEGNGEYLCSLIFNNAFKKKNVGDVSIGNEKVEVKSSGGRIYGNIVRNGSKLFNQFNFSNFFLDLMKTKSATVDGFYDLLIAKLNQNAIGKKHKLLNEITFTPTKYAATLDFLNDSIIDSTIQDYLEIKGIEKPEYLQNKLHISEQEYKEMIHNAYKNYFAFSNIEDDEFEFVNDSIDSIIDNFMKTNRSSDFVKDMAILAIKYYMKFDEDEIIIFINRNLDYFAIRIDSDEAVWQELKNQLKIDAHPHFGSDQSNAFSVTLKS